ncbi:MAG: CPBP family intramembrane metalloprotease [Thermoplasmata archaeon]|nr:CPBP family intramembrane metalloprotease [Thermoplasmata archaeon]
MWDGLPATEQPTPSNAGPGRYVLAVVVTVLAILSQYAVPGLVPALRPLYGAFLGRVGIVYGVPILAFLLLVGAGPLSRSTAAMGKAAVEGLRWFGLFSALAFLVSFVVLIVYTLVDPAAIQALSRPNPELQSAAANPAFWIVFSFVAGAIEELVFRGWMFGYWTSRTNSRWIVHAIWTSALFGGVHLYYGTTYGAASGVIFPTLFLLGLSFAVTFRYSGGNIVVIALLHGGYDATSFLSLVSSTAAEILRFAVLGVGLVVALVVYLRARRARPPIRPWSEIPSRSDGSAPGPPEAARAEPWDGRPGSESVEFRQPLVTEPSPRAAWPRAMSERVRSSAPLARSPWSVSPTSPSATRTR